MNAKVKTFFDIFVKSLIPHPARYAHFLKIPLKKSFGYYINLVLFATVLYSIYIATTYTPGSLKKNLLQIRTIFSRYPKDMTIEISKGFLYTNRGMSYSVWLEDGEKVRKLVEINDAALPQQIHDSYAFVLVTGKEIVLRSTLSKNKTYTIPLSLFKDQMITKKTMQQYETIIDSMSKNSVLYYAVFFLFLFVCTFIISFFKISFSLLLASAAAYGIMLLFAKKMHYTIFLHIGFHAITFPVAIMAGLRFFNGFLPFASFTALVLLFLITGIYEVYYGKKPAHHHS